MEIELYYPFLERLVHIFDSMLYQIYLLITSNVMATRWRLLKNTQNLTYLWAWLHLAISLASQGRLQGKLRYSTFKIISIRSTFPLKNRQFSKSQTFNFC